MRPETARNKPLIESRVRNLAVRTMSDIGADLNVISHKMAENILKPNPAVKIKQNVTCATGSSVRCLGEIQLNVAIGLNHVEYFPTLIHLNPQYEKV